MTRKLKVWFLTIILTVAMLFSFGCDSGNINIQDAIAVQLETSLISGMNSFLAVLMYKAFGVYDQASQLGAV